MAGRRVDKSNVSLELSKGREVCRDWLAIILTIGVAQNIQVVVLAFVTREACNIMLGPNMRTQFLGGVVGFLAWCAGNRILLGTWKRLNVEVNGQDVSFESLLLSEGLVTAIVATTLELLLCLVSFDMTA